MKEVLTWLFRKHPQSKFSLNSNILLPQMIFGINIKYIIIIMSCR